MPRKHLDTSFNVVGMNRKWKRFADNSLMPVPQMPPISPVKP